MGDVRIPAAATLSAALIAVVGSIIVVWLNGRVQRHLLVQQQQGQSAERRAQWAEDRLRASEVAQGDACVRFDAAVIVALSRLQRVVDLADRPGVRRPLLGRDWPQQWEARLQEALTDMILPYSALRYAANPPLLAAADAVMDALSVVATTAGAVPKPLPPNPASLLHRKAVTRWRTRIDDARGDLHAARRELVAVLDQAPDCDSPSATPTT